VNAKDAPQSSISPEQMMQTEAVEVWNTRTCPAELNTRGIVKFTDGTIGKWLHCGTVCRALLFLVLCQLPILIAVLLPSAARANSSPQSQSSWSGIAADSANAISGNPGAVNVKPGIGLLGRTLGFGPDTGVFLGGLWSGDADYLIGGGNNPKSWNLNSLALIGLDLDFEKLIGLRGGELGAAFLQFDGQPANRDAGVVTGYDGLTGPPPLDRSELYQLWWRQRLFDNKLTVRVGKVVPTYDFNNVIRPVPVQDESLSIPAVTGLIYTPVFVNPSILGVLPGYYNSAYGITTTFTPGRNWYLAYGIYDGNLARGRQTGIYGTPDFSGYYFQIGEVGTAWLLGRKGLPGSIGVGGWGQMGKLTAGSGAHKIEENGAEGSYAFGSQRIWLRHPALDNSGVSAFFQLGINNSSTLPASEYVGLGLTSFGLIPFRPTDSIGVGSAWSWLNRAPGTGTRSNEFILQTYYQAHVLGPIFVQPTLSYMPNPGQSTALSGATALTLQSTVLF
jgi:porin